MRDAIFTIGLLLGVLSAWADGSQAHAGFIISIEGLDRPSAPSMGDLPSRDYDYWSEPGSSSIVFWETGRDSLSPRVDSLRDILSILLSASHNVPNTKGTTGSSVKTFDSPSDGLLSRPDADFPRSVGRVFVVLILPPSTPLLSGLFRPPRIIS